MPVSRTLSYPGVYPRGCGGTIQGLEKHRQSEGLSPRVRGNPAGRHHDDEQERSIPAGAGEPRTDRESSPCQRVYPRGCGGTEITPPDITENSGLSPRVRGNLLENAKAAQVEGSIPAGAGEPRSQWCCQCRTQVYPRGCGGTGAASRHRAPQQGLSPRVRGNPMSKGGDENLHGSIPAGAGEPFWLKNGRVEMWVYPRGCGGTTTRSSGRSGSGGLSPRVRGNRRPAVSEGSRGRSIPAGAGEPSRGSDDDGRRWVYPRGCGGTVSTRKATSQR